MISARFAADRWAHLIVHTSAGTIAASSIRITTVRLAGERLVRVQSGPSDVPSFPFNRLQHVIARHTAAAVNPKPRDGMFLPEWSTVDKLRFLANWTYQQARSMHFGPAKGPGDLAYVVGALTVTDTATGVTTPKFIGSESYLGPPTNIVVVFLNSNFEFWTMYPTSPIVHYYGDDWS